MGPSRKNSKWSAFLLSGNVKIAVPWILSVILILLVYANYDILVLWFGGRTKEIHDTVDITYSYHRARAGASGTNVTHHSHTPEDESRLTNLGQAFTALDIPNPHVTAISCQKVINRDIKEITRGREIQNFNPRVSKPDSYFIEYASNCDKFITDRKYIINQMTQEEADFPIAYSLMMFKDVEQTERLLRAIYRPQNYYCIHIDKKSDTAIKEAMKAIAGCFDNVFIASQNIDVQWAWYSVLEPDILCMQELWKYRKWRYFINLTGQEFPLKTNRELVKILMAYKGANDVEGTEKRRNKDRTSHVHDGYYPTSKVKKPPPVDVTLTKGSVHIAASRAFVDYILHNEDALSFLKWVKDTGVPDETFFSSLNHSPQLGVPGAYIGEPETHPILKPFMTRFKNWGTFPFAYPCFGKRVRMICVFGLEDVVLLSKRPEMFANKFHYDYQPLAYDCLEELIFNRTKEEYVGGSSFSTAYYEQLSFVNNHN